MPKVVNIHAAKTGLSRLVARVERGEKIVIARNGKPAALLTQIRGAKKMRISLDDPIFHLDLFGFDGPGGRLDNREIDRVVYGK